MKTLYRIAVSILLFSSSVYAQNNVGINTSSPDASAALDVSSTSQGMLVPRMSKAQRDAINQINGLSSPATGLLIYQNDNTPGFYFYNGSSWASLNGTNGSAGPQGPAGNNGTDGQNTLVKTSTETAGLNCATGGVKLEYGLDANSNATLDADEINDALTKYLCNGSQGIQGVAGLAGATGPQGPAGTNGQGIPTGGTANQVLAKVDATNYSTAWVTPAAASGAVLQLYANKSGGTGENCPVAVSTTPTTIAFNNILNAPTGTNTWTSNNTFTVGTGQAGLYMIQVRVHTPDASPASSTVSVQLSIQINGSSYGSLNNIYGPYPTLNTNTIAGTKGKGEIIAYVYLNAGDNFKIWGLSANSSTAAQALSADTGSNIMVLKIN